MKNKTGNAGEEKFFIAYFAVIVLILIWNLFHCTEVSWLTRDCMCDRNLLQVKTEDTSGTGACVELLDDSMITVNTADDGENRGISSGAVLRGAALLGYENTNHLRFGEERVRAQICRTGSEDLLGEGTVFLRNQTPYPADETMLYITLSQPVSGTAGEKLEIRFSSSGLTRNGVFFTGEAPETSDSSGQGRIRMARLFYEKKSWRPFTSILYFLLEAAAGLFCLMLFRKKELPFSCGRAAGAKSERRKWNGRHTAYLAGILAVVLFSMLFTWLHTISVTVRFSSAEILVPESEDHKTVRLDPGDGILQSFVSGQNMLSGIGIRLSDTAEELEPDSEASEDASSVSGAGVRLNWRILDESGEKVLAEGNALTGELKRVGSVLSRDAKSQELSDAAGKYVFLPLNTVIREAKGKTFMLDLSLSGTEKPASVKLYATEKTNGELLKTGNSGTDSGEPMEICLLGVYNNRFMKGVFVRLCIAALLILAALYMAAHVFRLSTPALYMACALSMGLVFSFMTPAYTVSDERTHIDTVYIISNRLLGITDVPGYEKIWKRACDIDSSMNVTMPITAARYRDVAENLMEAAPGTGRRGGGSAGGSVGGDSAMETAGNGRTEAAGRELTACYGRTSIENVSILCFLPSAVGFSIARLLGRNLITMIMAARWSNLLVCVLILYFAIRRMPYGGACLAVIGLFPKTLQQMASCSYDGIVIAGTFLFLSYCLAAAFDEKYSIVDLLILFLSGFFVASSKGGAYLPVLGMAVLIPFAKRRQAGVWKEGRNKSEDPYSRKAQKISRRDVRMWDRITAVLLGSSAVLFLGKFVTLVFGMFTRASGSVTSGAGEQTRVLYTLSDFIHAPDKLIHIYLNTVNMRGDGLIGELVGKNLSQRWYIIYGFLFLAFLGMLRVRGLSETESGRREGGNHIRLQGRIWVLFLAACSCALIFLSMLIAFTTKGAMYIEGLQGRYFLPVAPLFFLACENGILRRESLEDRHILYCASVLLAVTFSQILLYYFGGI